MSIKQGNTSLVRMHTLSLYIYTGTLQHMAIHIYIIYTHAYTFQSCANDKGKSALKLTGTDYSCIIRVGAGTAKVIGPTAALGQIQLCPHTRNERPRGRSGSYSSLPPHKKHCNTRMDHFQLRRQHI